MYLVRLFINLFVTYVRSCMHYELCSNRRGFQSGETKIKQKYSAWSWLRKNDFFNHPNEKYADLVGIFIEK